MLNYEIIIPSHRPQLRLETQLHLSGFNTRVFDGTGYPSFAKLINDCIVSSCFENIIICNDKARPTKTHIQRLLFMLNTGWGLVGLYRFGFFAFKKDLIRKIGFFDERYLGGGYEDNDMILRLKEADISYYESEEIPYNYLPTSWHYETNSPAKEFYYIKWELKGDIYIRRLPEEEYGYDLGPSHNTVFSSFTASVLLPVRGNLMNQTMQVDLLTS